MPQGRAARPLIDAEKAIIDDCINLKMGVHGAVAALAAKGFQRSHMTVRRYMRAKLYEGRPRRWKTDEVKLRKEAQMADLEVRKAAARAKADQDRIAALYGDARYQDEPAEVWKSRTRQPVFVRPPAATRQTLGGVTGALA